MSLVIDAHKSVVNVALRRGCNAFINHLETDFHGQDKVQNYALRAQARVENRKSDMWFVWF
jgi:hypothetical protein